MCAGRISHVRENTELRGYINIRIPSRMETSRIMQSLDLCVFGPQSPSVCVCSYSAVPLRTRHARQAESWRVLRDAAQSESSSFFPSRTLRRGGRSVCNERDDVPLLDEQHAEVCWEGSRRFVGNAVGWAEFTEIY